MQLDDGPVCQGVGEGEAKCQEAKDCLTQMDSIMCLIRTEPMNGILEVEK